jgi:hypothetical protein
MSYGYIVLLAIAVLAYVLWRRGGAFLAIVSVVVVFPAKLWSMRAASILRPPVGCFA